MATVTTRPWDAAEHLETLEDVIEYLRSIMPLDLPPLTNTSRPWRT